MEGGSRRSSDFRWPGAAGAEVVGRLVDYGFKTPNCAGGNGGDQLGRGRNAATILSGRCASREEEFECARENAVNGVARCCLMDMVVEEAESCLLRSH